MSELLVNTIKKADGTGSLTVPAESGTVVTTASPSLGRRNIVQNGDMRIIQRGAGPFTTNGNYPIDRFRALVGGTGAAMSAQQDSDAPAGFNYSFKYTVTSPNTANDGSSRINTTLEGQDIAHLNFGSANAQTVTISFWVKSSVTGTYAFALLNGDNTRSYVTEYSISSASTWEQKTITIAGDTSGTWSTTNTGGVQLRWPFNSRTSWNPSALDQWETGQYMTSPNAVDFIGTNGATFYLTGVQLEVGSVATPFEHRSYGEELALCQRYFQKIGKYEVFGAFYNADSCLLTKDLPVLMRATPSISYSGSLSDAIDAVAKGTRTPTSGPSSYSASGQTSNVSFLFGGMASTTTYNPAGWFSTTPIFLDSEL